MEMTQTVSLLFLWRQGLPSAPKWSSYTKRLVFIACTIIIGLAVWGFGVVLAPLIVAVIIAYLLNPLVNLFTSHTPLSRRVAAPIVYILFLFVLILIPSLLTPLVVQQIAEVDIDLQGLLDQFNRIIASVSGLTGLDINIDTIAGQIEGSLDQVVSYSASIAADLAVGIAGGFIWAIFIFVVGFYFLLDANRFSQWVDSWVPEVYQAESKQLRRALDGVWKSYFIGQLTLAIIVGFVIGAAAAILGIRSALLLGLVAAFLELIPNWGYGISGTVGVIFAYFQGSTWIPLPPWAFALLVAGFYFIMWQN